MKIYVKASDSAWDNSWRDDIPGDVRERLAACCNRWNDIRIMGRAMQQVNPDRTAEECAERILEWVCDWNNQYTLDPTKEQYNELVNYIGALNASTIIANKTLCVRHGDTIGRYRFARQDGRGEEYIGDNWWESYIVTPEDQLLVWTMRGNYIPSAREFWIDEGNAAISASEDINAPYDERKDA